MDITNSLVGSSNGKRKGKPSSVPTKAKSKSKTTNTTPASAHSSTQKQKRQQYNDYDGDDDGNGDDDDDDDDEISPSKSRKHASEKKQDHQDIDSDDSGFISNLLNKANIKQGKEVAKRQKNLKANREVIGGGSFQSMGLKPTLLKTLLQRGFTTPTPIQRAAMPAILSTPPRDLVGMARTGSGKTLAYMVPLIQRLGGVHSVSFGIKSLILVPTRELALQVLKVGKDISRTSKDRGGGSETTEALRWGLIVGGDPLEDQFKTIAANPDIVIATPGRLLHLIVEMNLDLKSTEYVVFDEADRLFEMGFAVQLHEILHRLPPSRQTLLFSATLPTSLVEFAKAGLQNPKLVRLDADTKISSDLQMAFLNIKPDEKLAALMCLLRDVIHVPYGKTENDHDGTRKFSMGSSDDEESEEDRNSKSRHKRQQKQTRKEKRANVPADMESHQTIIFSATKHHVELLEMILTKAGYLLSVIYGSMDQGARKANLSRFRMGKTNILVVTDLAARGIDIPILENVINYDFPIGPKAFVHRVGRTARAGRKGWAFSLVTRSELAHFLDLQLFLSRPLHISSASGEPQNDLSETIVLGTVPRDSLDMEIEHVQSSLIESDASINAQLGVVSRAQKMYERSQSKASTESHRRAKDLFRVVSSKSTDGVHNTATNPGASDEIKIATHPIFRQHDSGDLADEKDDVDDQNGEKKVNGQPLNFTAESSKAALLRTIENFTPHETTFEIGKRGSKSEVAKLMKDRRSRMMKSQNKKILKDELQQKDVDDNDDEKSDNDGFIDDVGMKDNKKLSSDEVIMQDNDDDFANEADEAQLQEVFDMIPHNSSKKARKPTDFRDDQFFLSYSQPGAEAEKGYSLGSGDITSQSAVNKVAYDIGAMDEDPVVRSRPSTLKWDRKNKKFVKGDGIGADNKKMVKTESGVRLPATYRSGVYDEWRSKNRLHVPKIGERELSGSRGMMMQKRHYRYNARKGGDSTEKGSAKGASSGTKGKEKGKARSFGHAEAFKGRNKSSSGLKTVDQMAKERRLKANRTRRSTQPSRKK